MPAIVAEDARAVIVVQAVTTNRSVDLEASLHLDRPLLVWSSSPPKPDLLRGRRVSSTAGQEENDEHTR